MLAIDLLALQLNFASFLSLELMKNLFFTVYVLPDAKCRIIFNSRKPLYSPNLRFTNATAA